MEQQKRGVLQELQIILLRSRRVRLSMIAVGCGVLLIVVQSSLPVHEWVPSFGLNLGLTALLALFLAGHICEYVDSSLGMGYGTTLTPVLLLVGFEPLDIVPAVLFSEFVTGLTAGLLHHRDGNVDLLRDKRAQGTMLLLSALSVVGALAAVTVAVQISKFWLTVLIGSIVLAVGIVILATVRRQLAYRRGHIVALGAIAAFNKGLSGGGYGPLVTGGQVVSGISPKAAVAITSLAESLTCLVGLISYMWLRGNPSWSLAIPLTIGAVLSVPMATMTVRRLPETVMRCSVGVVTCLLGLLTLTKVIW